jgi:hypothetical protein
MEKPELKKVFERAATIIKEEKAICQHCDVSCDPKTEGDDDSTAVSDWKEERTQKAEPCQHCDVSCDPKKQGDDDSTAVSDWKEERAK